MDPFCKIYVDSDLDRGELTRKIASILSGQAEGYAVVADCLEVDVRLNEDRDERLFVPDWQNFVHSRYYLDVEPTPEGDHQRYVQRIGHLLEALWASGASAIAAADFEDELPRRGGLHDANR